MKIKDLLERPDLLEVGRIAIEDALIDLRNSRIAMPFRNDGLVIREEDGTSSSIIRLGTEDALRIGIRAILKHLDSQAPCNVACTSRLEPCDYCPAPDKFVSWRSKKESR